MRAIGTLWFKEMIDVLRDRRTLALMLLVPVALYPLLLGLIGLMTVAGHERLANEELAIAVVGEEAQALVGTAPPAHTHFLPMTREAAEAALRAEGEKAVRAAVVVAPDAAASLAANRQVPVTLLYTKRSDRSIEARDRLRKLLEQKGTRLAEERLARANLPATFAEPLQLTEQDVEFAKNMGPLVASRLLPSILLMMLFMGAFYAALDLTAGEKERGTLETLLVAPVRPLEVMLAKYLAVAIVAVVTSLVNLGAMAMTFRLGLQLGEGMEASVSLTAGQVLTLLLGLVPAACLVSALSLAVASLARTYKEGQGMLTPLLMAGILPGVAAQMPGVELSAGTAMVPLLNVALLVRAVVLGPVPWTHVVLTLISVSACCGAALWMAANAFKSEALRFGGVEGWRELFRLK